MADSWICSINTKNVNRIFHLGRWIALSKVVDSNIERQDKANYLLRKVLNK